MKRNKSYSDKMWLLAKIVMVASIPLAFVLWILLHRYTDHIWACTQSMGGILAAAAVAYLLIKTSKRIFRFIKKVIHVMRAISQLQNQTK